MFGRIDPKDEVIEALRNERDYLRVKIAELEKHLLALTSTHAFRLLHPEEAAANPPKPAPPDPYTLRDTEHTPERSLEAISQDFVGYSQPSRPSEES